MASVSSLKDRARKEEQRGNWSRAADLYGQALRRAEEQGDLMRELGLYNRIGDLHLRMKDVDGAVLSFLQATDRYEEEGLPAPAVALCNKILRVSPNEEEVRLRLMRLHLSAGLVADARQVLVEYVRRADAADRDEEALVALLQFLAAAEDEALRLEAADRLADAGRLDDAARELVRVRATRAERGESVAAVDARLSRLAPELVPEPERAPPPPEPETARSPEAELAVREEPAAAPAEAQEPEVAAEPEPVASQEPGSAPAPEPGSRKRKRKATPPARRKGRSRPRRKSSAEDSETRAEPAAAAGDAPTPETRTAEPALAEETGGDAPYAEPSGTRASPDSGTAEPRARESRPRIPRHARDLPASLPPMSSGAPIRTDLVRFQLAVADLAPAVVGRNGGASPVGTRKPGSFAADIGGFAPPGPGSGLLAPRPETPWLIPPIERSWVDRAAGPVSADDAGIAHLVPAPPGDGETAGAVPLDTRAELSEMGSWTVVGARPGPDGPVVGSLRPVDGAATASSDGVRVALRQGEAEPRVRVAEPDRMAPASVRVVREMARPAVVEPGPVVADSGGAVGAGDALVEPRSPVTAAEVAVDGDGRLGNLSPTARRLEPEAFETGPQALETVQTSATDGLPAPAGAGGWLEVGFRRRAFVPEAEQKNSHEETGVLRGLRFLRGLRRAGGEQEEAARPEGLDSDASRPRPASRGEVPGLASIGSGFDAASVRATKWAVSARPEPLEEADADLVAVAAADTTLAEPEDLSAVRAPWEPELEPEVSVREAEAGEAASSGAEQAAGASTEPEASGGEVEVLDAGPEPRATEETGAGLPESAAEAPEAAAVPESGVPAAEVESDAAELEAAQAEPEVAETRPEAEPEAGVRAAEAEPEAGKQAAEPEPEAEAASEADLEAPETPEPALPDPEPSAAIPEGAAREATPRLETAPEAGPDEGDAEESLTEVLRRRWAEADGEEVPDEHAIAARGGPDPDGAPPEEPARSADAEEASPTSEAEEAETFSPAASFLAPAGECDEDFPNLTGMLEDLGWLGGAEAGEPDGQEAADADEYAHPSPWKATARPSSPPASQRPGRPEADQDVDEEMPNLTDMLRTMGWLSAGTESADPSTPGSDTEGSGSQGDADSTRSER